MVSCTRCLLVYQPQGKQGRVCLPFSIIPMRFCRFLLRDPSFYIFLAEQPRKRLVYL